LIFLPSQAAKLTLQFKSLRERDWCGAARGSSRSRGKKDRQIKFSNNA
jgi:hypothetical protein